MNGCKVFSATMAKQRESLGDDVTMWMRKNPHLVVFEKQVIQSSDSNFHCLTIVLWYKEDR